MRRLTDRLRGWLGGELRIPLALFAVALVIRIAVVIATPGYEPAFDSADYHRHAESIAAQQGYPTTSFGLDGGSTAFRPPLYPYLLATVYQLTGARLTPARLVDGALGALTVLLIYLIAQRIWGRRIARVAGGLAAVFPPLVLTNASIQSESLFVPLMLGSILAVLSYRRSGAWRWVVLAGVLCGLGALTRSNGVLFAVPLAIGVWGSPRLTLRAAAAPALAVLCTMLAIAPWTLRNAVVFDAFVPLTTQSGFALAGTYNDESHSDERYPASWRLPQQTRMYERLYARKDLNEAELDAKVRSRALDYALDHPGYIAESTWYQTLRILSLAPEDAVSRNADRNQQGLGATAADIVRWCFFLSAVLAFAGAVVVARRPRGERGPLFLWLFPVFALLGAITILGSARYRIPVYPFLILLNAFALTAAFDLLRARRGERGSGA